MGYTNPFASSTGLSFLLTVLNDFADGDEDRLVAADVASVFEAFSEQVPFVALATPQMRESVENDNGTLDAFVMEWQTFENTDSLRSGFEFLPFGVRHDNPLYQLDGASGDPAGDTMIRAQRLWKDKKDAGRPVYAVFVTDRSGSMLGSRMAVVKQALGSSPEFINPDASIGMVEFSDGARKVLEIAPFNLNQQALFGAAIEDMDPAGSTAMYHGIVLGLLMLIEQRDLDPSG